MALPFGRLQPFGMPTYRQPQRQMPVNGIDMIPQQVPPQVLGQQGPMQMGPGGLQPMASQAVPPASHPAMGGISAAGLERMPQVGGGAAVGSTSPMYRSLPGKVFDQFADLGPAPTAPRTPPGGFDQFADGRFNNHRSRPSPAAPSGFNWQPNPITPPSYGGGGYSPPPAPLLANNTAPNYRTGGGGALDPGQWHSPGLIGSSGAVWNQNEAGAISNPGYSQSSPGGLSGGGGGGYGGYPGGNYNPLQAFIDAQNAANAANAARANNINQGWSGLRNYASGLLDQYSNQNKADANTSYDNAMSQSKASLINSGLANSSVLADQYARNARDRSAALNRVNDQVLGRRLDTELPLAQQQFAFNERIDQNAPDPRLLAQLAQGAAGAGGGGGMFIGSGDIPYDMPGQPAFMSVPWMYGGYRGGSQLQRGNANFGGNGSFMGGQGAGKGIDWKTTPGAPKLFGPGGVPILDGGSFGEMPGTPTPPYPPEYDFGALFPPAPPATPKTWGDLRNYFGM